MLDQSFTPNSLKHLLLKEDIARFRVWRPHDNKDEILRNTVADINSPLFAFPIFQEKVIKGKIVYSAPDISTLLALRKIDRNLRAIYKVKQSNRDEIISQVKCLLKEGCSYTISRLDIKSCYESIDRNKVVQKIKRDGLLSHKSISLIDKLFGIPQFFNKSGLPRGLAISATLAELFLRSIDRKIHRLDHVYFYARYVDDIVLFSTAPSTTVLANIDDIVKQDNLQLNREKCCMFDCGSETSSSGDWWQFDLLGYTLYFKKTLLDAKKWRDVKVSFSQSRIKKIKSRIIHAFVDFALNRNFDILENRLKFLSMNYLLKKNDNGALCGGIYFSYQHLTEMGVLNELDVFLRRIIFSRNGSLGRRLVSCLTEHYRTRLSRLSFQAGFTGKWMHTIDRETLSMLKSCWVYEKN